VATDFFCGHFQKKDDKCPKTVTASASKKKNSENDKREGRWEGAKRANLSRYPVAVIDSSAKATQTRQATDTQTYAVETENLPRNLCHWMLEAMLNLPALSS